jgi:hypothetical protein
VVVPGAPHEETEGDRNMITNSGRLLISATARCSVIVVGLVIFLSAATEFAEADERYSYGGLAIFSDLALNATEGEFYGLQIAIVPYDSSGGVGQKVLWRSAGGKLDAPLLLDAIKVGDTFKVHVPEENDSAGDWTLSVKGNFMAAVGPRGLKFNLKRLNTK